MLRRCRVSVSQAGYNTVLDILAARAAAVVVPFAAERETEQTLRAGWLAERGVVELVAEAQLSPDEPRSRDRTRNRARPRGGGRRHRRRRPHCGNYSTNDAISGGRRSEFGNLAD